MRDETGGARTRYPLSMRLLHWLRAILIIGMIWSGWFMTGLPDEATAKFAVFYPNHKQFGVLVWLLALVHLGLRYQHRRHLPHPPVGLRPWERVLSHLVHRAIMVLTLLTPLLGYAMSASFTQSDGVPFFGLGQVPELLPKNDKAFALFDTLHGWSAYTLAVLVVLHVAGALKHRLHDRGGDTDVLARMV
ncbi:MULTISPECIES: cytochrome b [unclassified Novosphingobium]|uniref:cytochrome b n=1 Tax=unclassified Novosphingobium TaxID=2644732 RepID=UPI0006B8C8AF|nr:MULTISPECIES: cytochrome b [unclassified Novosphingobium]KPF56401.1 cytochrome B [Novosphingobium sp. AAP1]MBB3357190.1 cytochrome b561 [Novosphingobium sp. BK256]MBB3374148.1 cytochrome b561 [Novosphingobium sp. BK280]MBB3378560.1 cytochrome b561 [Novosphingobium sp. BK258]MBB3419656.1 cytochrome b561 [Novosphingobium sp. BK267]